MKKFAKKEAKPGDIDVDGHDIYALLERRTQYFLEKDKDAEFEKDKTDDEEESQPIEKEQLIRGYRYGASFVPTDEHDAFERLEPNTGIDICGFFLQENVSVSMLPSVYHSSLDSSFDVIGPLERSSMSGLTPTQRVSRSPSRLLFRRWRRRELWLSRDGLVEVTQRWEC